MSVQSPRRNPVPFGTYLLLDRINIGGMAEVWRGKSFGAEGFERMVAIKRILPNIAEEADFKSMFIDEAKLSVLLSHANIAQVYELGDLHGSLYIAMEYVAGKDLRFVFERARKHQDPLPIPLVCHVIQRVAEGLDHAHRKKDQAGRELNIVHRDVSPQNVLLSYDGEVKVIDFGIAKAAGWGTNTQTGVLKGKFGYMSPEQVMGEKVDRRSDVFALGVCLYELLTGERLFQGESDFSVLEKVANVDVQRGSPKLHGLPDDLAGIVSRALAKSPEDRYPYASDLAEDLARYLHTAGRYFGRKDLMEFMHDAFGEDIDKELDRQKDYASVSATPEILEEIERSRSAKPQRTARTHTGEVPLSLPPPDAAAPTGELTTAGSRRGARAQSGPTAVDLASVPEPTGAPIDATSPGTAHDAEADGAWRDTQTRPQAPTRTTHPAGAPATSDSPLHLDTHIGPPPEQQVDVALVNASTHVGPAPTRAPAGIADGDTRIGPAPKAPAPAAPKREMPRRSPTVGMPIPGILTMETHVGAAPLPPAPSPDAPEDSTTGSSGDPRRGEAEGEEHTDAGPSVALGDALLEGSAPLPDQGSTLAVPSRLPSDPPDATLPLPSDLGVEDPGETLSMPTALADGPLEDGGDATLGLPADLSSAVDRERLSTPVPTEGADTLATPSRLTSETATSQPLASPRARPPARSPGARSADGPERRRPRRGDAEERSPAPALTTPLSADMEEALASELDETTDAEGHRRTQAGRARQVEPPEDTDAEHRRPGGAGAEPGARHRSRGHSAEEAFGADRGYAEQPEEDTDAGPRRRAPAVAGGRGGSARSAVGASADFEPDEDEALRDDPEEDDARYDAPDEDDGLEDDAAYAEDGADPETYARPRQMGRARPLPIGSTRFDGLFDAKARRFTRRDLWLAGVAGAALALVLTLLVSVASGPTGSGMILVEVVGVAPSKTTVRLAGKELPRTLQFPVRATAPLGEVEIELSAEGYRPAKHLVRLTQSGEVAELRTSLEPL